MRDKLHAYLLERPSGATPGELLDLIFTQPGADREFAPRFLHLLLSADARFAFEPSSSRWVATAHTALARRLDDTEFVVVDLETTGGAPSIDAGARGHGIIEIGGLRLRGGRIVDRFSSLVHPGRRLPFFITQLTGITDAMLADAPTIDAILPRFIDFAADAVLIAHNAAFDLAFLDTARVQLSGTTFDQPHLCTLRLARRLTPQLRRRSLDALGGFFGIPLVDRHRAMGDARITAELFFHFLELARRRGIVRLAELLDLQHCAADGRRFVCQLPRAQVLRLPRAPGIYRFTDEAGRLLYIGKARNLRQRVGSYLVNTSAQRRTVLDMVRHVRDVAVEATGSELEASLREAEEIRRCQPPYNKLGKHLPRIAFLKLTLSDPFPRLMITNRLPAARRASANGLATGRGLFGPFRSRAAAQHAQHLVARLFSLRTCTGRLTPGPDVTPCLQGQIGACSAPCTTAVDRVAYAEQVAAAERFFAGETDTAAASLERRRDRHSATRRFEAAAKAQREIELVRRMGRRQRTMSWIVARQHFAVMQAAADGARALLYGVVHGRLVARGTARAPADLAEFAARLDAQLRTACPHTAEPQDIDGSVILAAWLRERGESDGYVFPLGAEAPVHTQLPEWEAALASVLRLEPVAAADAGAGSARRRHGGAGAG